MRFIPPRKPVKLTAGSQPADEGASLKTTAPTKQDAELTAVNAGQMPCHDGGGAPLSPLRAGAAPCIPL